MTSTCGGIRAANWVIRRRRLKSDNYLKRCNLPAMALLVAVGVAVVVVVDGAKYPCNDRAYFQAPIILSRLHRQVSTVRKSITYLPDGSRSANSENRFENREYRSSRWELTGSDHENWVRWGTRRSIIPNEPDSFLLLRAQLLINECIAYSVFCNLLRRKSVNEVCLTSRW